MFHMLETPVYSAAMCYLQNWRHFIVCIITGYIVTVTSDAGSISYPYDNTTLSALVIAPATSYTVTVQALNSVGPGLEQLAATGM